jgi:hypothetical protein
MAHPFCNVRDRMIILHRWSNPETVELLNDSALVFWGTALLLPGDGLRLVSSLVFLSGLFPDWMLGLPLLVTGVVQQWACLCRIRPWRRRLLLVGLAWWVFLVAAILLDRGLTPALGTYLPLACGCFWAQLRVSLHERDEDRLNAGAQARGLGVK